MIKQIKSKKTSRFYARFLSLLVILSLLVTSGTTAIAVKSYRASHTLSQQTFTLTPEEGVTVTLNGLMPDNGYAEAKPAEGAPNQEPKPEAVPAQTAKAEAGSAGEATAKEAVADGN